MDSDTAAPPSETQPEYAAQIKQVADVAESAFDDSGNAKAFSKTGDSSELAFAQDLRRLEALLFSCRDPLKDIELQNRLGRDANINALLERLKADYAGRGIELVSSGAGWRFRTAPDLAAVLVTHPVERRKLSRAAMEALTIIAYHQPITRAEIDAVRGVANGRSALDALLETGWIRAGARRRAPGRPLTWITTEAFLDHFAFESLDSLPGLNELTASGLLNHISGDVILSEQMEGEGGPRPDQLDLELNEFDHLSDLEDDLAENELESMTDSEASS